MTERQSLCACALLGVIISLGPLGVSSSWGRHAEARTIADIEPPKAQRTLEAPPSADQLVQRARANGPLTPSAGGYTSAAPSATATPAAEATPHASASPASVASPSPTAARRSPSASVSPTPSATATTAPEPLLKRNQMIVFYGSPISAGLGILGTFAPEDAAARVKAEADIYDSINGAGRGAFGAMDLIYSQVQSEPTENGLYLRYLSDETVQTYLSLAEKYDLQLILDLQIGRGDVVDEVRKTKRFLKNPRVHIAIDPEYAVGPQGIPLETPGQINADDLNRLQDYLTGLIAREQLPPKMVIIHQYLEETVVDGAATKTVPNVDLVLNMDAFGAAQEKNTKYQLFAARPYATRSAFNIFFKLDEHVLSEEEAVHLNPSPDAIFYQ